MKSLVFLLLFGAILIGCSHSIQVVTLRASNLKPTSDGLILDNDTLKLCYSFASKRGLMHVTVYNKLNRPLYIDWKRSVFMIGKKTFAYWQDIADVQLTTSGYGYRNGSTSFAPIRTTTQGTISQESMLAFIPPHSELRKQSFVVFPKGTLTTQGTPDDHKDQARWSTNPRKRVSVRTYSYQSEQSPLQFRSYLTLATDKDFKTEFMLDTQFWASAVHIEPEAQALDMLKKLPDGSYKNEKSFAQKDGFYIPLTQDH